MHFSYAVIVLALFGAAAPALATSSQTPQKSEAELVAREPANLGPLAKELFKGLAGGAALSGVFGGISALTGGNAQRRALDERGVGSIIGKLVGATDDALGTVIKNGAITGAAFGTSSSISGGILNKIFGRDVESTMTQDDADELERQLEILMTPQQKRAIHELRALKIIPTLLPPIGGPKFGPLVRPLRASGGSGGKRDISGAIGSVGVIGVPKIQSPAEAEASRARLEALKKLMGQPTLNGLD